MTEPRRYDLRHLGLWAEFERLYQGRNAAGNTLELYWFLLDRYGRRDGTAPARTMM